MNLLLLFLIILLLLFLVVNIKQNSFPLPPLPPSSTIVKLIF